MQAVLDAVFALVALLHDQGRNFALLWFAVGLVYYAFYSRYRDRDAKAAVQKIECF